MSDIETLEDTTPLAHVTIAYLGPVAPHWEIRGHFGETKMIEDFWTRVTARLLLLPRHDPQFRRNKERVNRDAERERITLDWDLGDEESIRSTARPAAQARAAVVEPVVEEPAVEEPAVEAPVVEEPAVEDVAAENVEAVDAVVEQVEDAPGAEADEAPAGEATVDEAEASDEPEAPAE